MTGGADKSLQLAVFGSPVTHSLSPKIHAGFAAQFDLSLSYQKVEAGPQTFGRRLRTLLDSGLQGCNVTLPLKKEAWELANRVSARAQLAQAVNTMVFKGPDWYGDNTDGIGLVRHLQDNLGFSIAGKRVCVIGAGGAARGVIGPLLEAAPAALVVANRSPWRAEILGRIFRDLHPAMQTGSLEDLVELEDVDLLINATSVGHQGAVPALPDRLLNSATLCYDMNYAAASQPLRTRCAMMQLNYADGFGMLVEQAAESFFLWTGQRPQTQPLISELQAAQPAAEA